MLGFIFDWHEINQQLTGENFLDDSRPVERYAKALRLKAIVLDEEVFLGIPIVDEEEFNSGVYSSINVNSLDPIIAMAEEVREKLEATGVKPETPSCIFTATFED